MKRYIDINCDLGENRGDDAAVMKYISSANIACGAHAGDVDTIRRITALAVEYGVMTGAHPGYPDRENFGRLETNSRATEVISEVMEQISLFRDTIRGEGAVMSHIKLHGALYNRTASDYNLMRALTGSIIGEFGRVPIFTLAGSVSEKAVSDAGGIFISEGFSDRAYDNAGKLVPRSVKGAVLHDLHIISKRIIGLAEGKIESIDGNYISMHIDTLCVHGDTPGSVEIASAVHGSLVAGGYGIGRADEI